MIRSIIIDDLTPNRERFSHLLLSNFDNVAVIKATDNSLRAIHALRTHSPDLVFLHLTKPFVKGIQLLESARDMQISVILTCEQEDIHAQYAVAVRAMRYNIIDFVSAPYDVYELGMAIRKATKANKDKLSRSKQAVLAPEANQKSKVLIRVEEI